MHSGGGPSGRNHLGVFSVGEMKRAVAFVRRGAEEERAEPDGFVFCGNLGSSTAAGGGVRGLGTECDNVEHREKHRGEPGEAGVKGHSREAAVQGKPRAA